MQPRCGQRTQVGRVGVTDVMTSKGSFSAQRNVSFRRTRRTGDNDDCHRAQACKVTIDSQDDNWMPADRLRDSSIPDFTS